MPCAANHRQMATMLGQEPCLQLAHVPAAHPGAVADLQAGKERKGKERRAFLLLALEASWPIGEAPSPRTLDDSSEGNHPISEDARRLLRREQLAAGESTGTCG
jgi:hypothetical protein